MLQAIIDSFPSPDRSVLLLLYFDVISRKCKAVKIVIQFTFFLTNDELTWKNISYNKQERRPYLPYF